MAPLEYTSDSELSVDEIISEVASLSGVGKFEYEPKSGFLHATVDRAFCHPYDIVKKLEELGISADGLFIFMPQSP